MKKRIIKYIIGFMAVITIYPAQHVFGQAAKQYLLALSKADHTLAIVDPITYKIITRLPVGPDPHEVVASSDGTRAYVSNMGGGRLHEMNVLDLASEKALPNFDAGPLIGLHGLDFKGGKVWFTAEGAKSIGRYDPKTGRVDWIMGTGQNRTHMIYVSKDEKHIYTTNVESGTVSILEYLLFQPSHQMATMPPPPGGQMPPPPGGQPHSDWVESIIQVAKGSEGFDVRPDGKELWTAGSDEGIISVIDIDAKRLVASLDARVVGANRLKFTPDGKRVLISSLRTGDLVIYDAVSRKEIKRINIGRGAAGILVDADGSRAFIGCTADNYVAVIDLRTMEVIAHINVGGGPDGLAWAIHP